MADRQDKKGVRTEIKKFGIYEQSIEYRDWDDDALAALTERLKKQPRWQNHFPPYEWLKEQWEALRLIEGDGPHTSPFAEVAMFRKMMVARQMLDCAVENADVDTMLTNAVELGWLMSELNMKSWEQHALRGKVTIEGSARGGEARAAAFKPRHEAIKEDYRKRLTRLNDTSAAKAATMREFGICRRQLNRILAK